MDLSQAKKVRIPSRSIEQLEFDKIQAMVSDLCVGDAAKTLLTEQIFAQSIDEVRYQLSISSEIVDLFAEGYSLSLSEYQDVDADLHLLSKDGYVLDAEAVLRIGSVLYNYELFYKLFSKELINSYSNFYNHVVVVDYDRKPLKLIQKIFDPSGEVKADASPELTRISRRIEGVGRQIDKEFNSIVRKYKEANQLSDTQESIKNGRRVLAIPAEIKRKVSGIIHDHSASGKTVFIEPQEIMILNNDLFELENDKRAELYRILKDLSQDLRIYHGMIHDTSVSIAKMDLVLAKGRFSHQLKGVLPEIVDKPTLDLVEAKHPLLVLQESESGQKTIPFDLSLHRDNKLLLISGPNAGGKSVTLKAVGLIHLMIYHGLLVPVDEKSKIGWLPHIFTDIGDQQSIDEGLSTYSSHLTNLKNILASTDRHSLVLIDEIGSGTDPKLGGAIAEGILKSLLSQKVFGIVTTHYSQLKIFAFHNRGIVNGAMMFDKEKLTPSYKLKVGKPGSSYAFEVARKVGMPAEVVKYAKKKVGKKENEIEELLIDLQEGKAILDEQLAYIDNEKLKLDRLIRNYDDMNRQYEVKRKKLKIQAKEIELKKANDQQHELQQLINKLEKEKNLDKARELKQKVHQKRKQESSSINELKGEVFYNDQPDYTFEVGDYVRMVDGDLSGEILKLKNDKAIVLFGLIQMEVPFVDLRLVKEPLSINTMKHVRFQGAGGNTRFETKLDIRGYKMRDAEATLDEFFDKALLNNANNLEIIHGKGSGALRKLVIRKMKEYKDFESYKHADEHNGGDGVTFITV